MAEHIPFDDFFKKRLGEHASPVPEGIFDRLMQERAERPTEEQPQPSLSERLNNFESAVPTDMFDKIMLDRIDTEPQPSLAERLNNYDASVPADMFDRIIAERERKRPVVVWWQSTQFRWAMAASILLLFSALIGKTFFNQNVDTTQAVENNNDNAVVEREKTSSKAQNQVSQNYNLNNNQPSTGLDNAIGNKTVPITNKPTQRKNINKPELQQKNSDYPIKAVPNSTTITSNLEHFTNTIQNTLPNTTQHYYNPIITLPEEQKNKTTLLNPLAILNTEGLSFSPITIEQLKKDNPCFMPGTDACPTFTVRKAGRMRYYVDAYGAPEYAFRSLQPTTDEFTKYRDTRDTVERTTYGYSAGTRVTAALRNGIILRGGVVYTRNNEVLRKDSSTIRLVSVTISQLTGDTVAWNYEGGIIRKTRNNNMQTLDFTAQAGYEMPIGERLSIGFNAGVNINVLTRIKATVLDKDLQLLTLDESNTIYNKSVGLSLVGSIAAYYQLTDRLDLMVEPYGRKYLKPITKNPDYQLRQSYTNVGLAVGVRFKL